MNIPLQKLLTKMDAELQGAKTATSNSALRERIHSLKTLCELVLEEPANQGWQPTQPVAEPIVQAQAPIQAAVQAPTPMSVSVQSQQQQKRLEMDDGANGESLFDF
jgi:hypothetical protein